MSGWAAECWYCLLYTTFLISGSMAVYLKEKYTGAVNLAFAAGNSRLYRIWGGLFCKGDIVSYMFLKNQFVFYEFEKSVILVFFEYTAMMEMWVFISYHTVKGLRTALLK